MFFLFFCSKNRKKLRLLPAVQLEMYPHVHEILTDIWSPILPKDRVWGQKGADLEQEAKEFAKITEEWIFEMGVKEKLADFEMFKDNLEKMTQMGFSTLRHNSPLQETEEEVRRIYKNSMKPLL